MTFDYKAFLIFNIVKPCKRWLKYSVKTERSVLFVFGVQRSGTNMLMRLLDNSMDTCVYHETSKKTHDTYALRPIKHLKAVIAKSRAKCVIVKGLLESQSVHSLLSAFSEDYETQGIWVFRHYNDVINSNLRNWPDGYNQIHDVVKDPESADWRGRNMSEETLEVLRKHVTQEISQADAQALFWWYRNKLFFEQKLDKQESVRIVNYNTLVDSPESHRQMLASLLSINLSQKDIEFIHSKSLKKNIPPDLTPAIKALCEAMHTELVEATLKQTNQSAA